MPSSTNRIMSLDGPCPNSSFEESIRTVIFAETLIHGPASKEPTSDGVVILENGKIVYAGPREVEEGQDPPDLEPGQQWGQRVFRVQCCMPGMWDVHAHFLGALSRKTPHFEKQWKWTFEDRAVKVGRDVPRLKTILDSGFTSVREVGGLGKHLKTLVDEGSIAGPRIYHANCPIHITGGHCDHPSDVPLKCVANLCSIQDSNEFGGVMPPGVDGPQECLKAVRKNIREGASVIKICCSGGVLTENTGMPTQQQFNAEEVKAMTDEAALHDRIVCAHCHSKEGIMNALENGVKCIEHCTLADDEVINKMLEKDALMVPTRWVIEQLAEPGGIDGPKPAGMSELTWKKYKMVYDASREAHTKAISAGVKVATGCDIFLAEGYGTSAKELEYLVDLGMTPAKALEAATVNGPLSLGKQAPSSGELREGYDADVICLDVNPLEDIKVLQDSGRFELVFKGGKLMKNLIDSRVRKKRNRSKSHTDELLSRAKKSTYTDEFKLQVINKLRREDGATATSVARFYDISESTVRGFLRQEEEIKQRIADVRTGTGTSNESQDLNIDRKRYSNEFKMQVIEKTKDAGETIMSVSRFYGLPQSTVRSFTHSEDLIRQRMGNRSSFIATNIEKETLNIDRKLYSDEFKLDIIEKTKEVGATIIDVAKEHGLPSSTVRSFTHSEEVIRRRLAGGSGKTKSHYTDEFKLEVIKKMKEASATVTGVADFYDIPESTVRSFVNTEDKIRQQIDKGKITSKENQDNSTKSQPYTNEFKAGVIEKTKGDEV